MKTRKSFTIRELFVTQINLLAKLELVVGQQEIKK